MKHEMRSSSRASDSRRTRSKLRRSVTTNPAEQVKPGLHPPSAKETTPHVQDMATTGLVQGPHHGEEKISNNVGAVHRNQKF
ncbi:hypothetical protein NPIL_399041 [Nephila pilipes]|uniref:Uncharacterized protein n=1 Tax=Nephila pilipes TaxID=299642 RepID=A0A8X6QZ17_NEPPI|nr:hypothetical protein NPIL_399041 [Nephila pilipes]